MMRADLFREGSGRDAGASQPFVEVCLGVDDTDDVTKKTSTGEISERIAQEAVALGGRLTLEITRHQLLVRDDIPYTSHNSAMAFRVHMPAGAVDALRRRAAAVIDEMKADSADPGLCVAVLPDPSAGRVPGWEALMGFGQRAKEEFCSIVEAYALADSLSWVTLTSHGGDESGVVGALACVGLRLGGNDGRFRGRWDLAQLCPGFDDPRVGQVQESLAACFCGDVQIVDHAGRPLDGGLSIALKDEVKPVLVGHALTVVCDVRDGTAYPCKKVDLGIVGNAAGEWSRVCEAFVWDTDGEEQLSDQPSCANCLYRRWVERGFVCVKDEGRRRAGTG